MEKIQIFVQKHSSDGFTLSTIVDNQYFHQRYIGYSLTDAKRHFRNYVNWRVSY